MLNILIVHYCIQNIRHSYCHFCIFYIFLTLIKVINNLCPYTNDFNKYINNINLCTKLQVIRITVHLILTWKYLIADDEMELYTPSLGYATSNSGCDWQSVNTPSLTLVPLRCISEMTSTSSSVVYAHEFILMFHILNLNNVFTNGNGSILVR